MSASGISVPIVGQNTLVVSARLDHSDRSKHDVAKEEGFEVTRLMIVGSNK